jgi:protein-tyrosine phosphatase
VERKIDLEGCVNFRDLGGYPASHGRQLRWRILYRSDALHALSAADVVRFRDDLGITEIVDLRSNAELENEGRGRLESEPIAFHHLPLFSSHSMSAKHAAAMSLSLGERYIAMLDVAREPIARVIDALAHATGGAVYHCAAGKDRTGVISAVLLGVLGVPDDLIVADYALSSQNIGAIIERVMSMKGYGDTLKAMPADTLHAKPETMEKLLANVASRHGSMSGYLRDSGVSEATLDRLRAKCLD